MNRIRIFLSSVQNEFAVETQTDSGLYISCQSNTCQHRKKDWRYILNYSKANKLFSTIKNYYHEKIQMHHLQV
jgi:hypothetical protein